MRSLQDHSFAEYLMRIGNGIEPIQVHDMVEIPQQLAISGKEKPQYNTSYTKLFLNYNFIHVMYLIWLNEPY